MVIESSSPYQKQETLAEWGVGNGPERTWWFIHYMKRSSTGASCSGMLHLLKQTGIPPTGTLSKLIPGRHQCWWIFFSFAFWRFPPFIHLLMLLSAVIFSLHPGPHPFFFTRVPFLFHALLPLFGCCCCFFPSHALWLQKMWFFTTSLVFILSVSSSYRNMDESSWCCSCCLPTPPSGSFIRCIIDLQCINTITKSPPPPIPTCTWVEIQGIVFLLKNNNNQAFVSVTFCNVRSLDYICPHDN